MSVIIVSYLHNENGTNLNVVSKEEYVCIKTVMQTEIALYLSSLLHRTLYLGKHAQTVLFMFCLKNLRIELWFQQNFNHTLILWLLLTMYSVWLFL